MKSLALSLGLLLATSASWSQTPAPSIPAAAPAPAATARGYWVEVVLDHELQAWLDKHLHAGSGWRLHSVLPVPDGCLNEPKRSRVPCSRVIAQRGA